MSNAAPATDEPDRSGYPLHVAIIMDGNGRWAAARGLPRAEGHRRGVEVPRSPGARRTRASKRTSWMGEQGAQAWKEENSR